MPIFDDIKSLENSVQQVIEGTDHYAPVEDFKGAYVDAIINAFGDFSNDELSTVDIDKVVKQALQDSSGFIDQDLTQKIDSDVNKIVNDTMDFYATQDITLPNLGEAIDRTQAAQNLTEQFQTNMGSMRDDLLDETINTLKKHVAKGTISRASMTSDILEAADGKLFEAKTNARMVVSAYNRIGREQVRQDAELKHGYYDGEVRTTTRAFCRKCAGRTFDMKQIKQMSNGQGLPVKIYCGGWNCIHSWMWVDPEWDPKLKERFDAERSVVDLEDSGLDLQVPE